jgi:hypothetical protein
MCYGHESGMLFRWLGMSVSPLAVPLCRTLRATKMATKL